MLDYRYYIIELVLRLFLGILLFFQGFDKVFRVKVKGVYETFETEAVENNHIPKSLLYFSAFFTSYTELIAGFLLITGLFKYWALTFIGLDLLIASLAFSIVKPMWDTRFVFPRLAVLTALFILPHEWEAISIDNLIQTLT